MKSNAAVIYEQPGKWQITEIEVGPPRQGEIVVRMVAAGLCHSDDHVATGDMPLTGAIPLVGGHEGAGIVEAVGPNTQGWEVGDHVVLPFLPSCGRCRWCASGMQNLCDNGARTLSGAREDGTSRHTLDGRPLGQMAGISTFSEYSTLSVNSAVKVAHDIDLVAACLTSCGVSTGWGAAVNSAQVRPGDVVIVVGVGGIGMNAVQGAALAGAGVLIAVDPVEWKRERALEFGATHAASSIEDAAVIARAHSDGQGADSTIVCVGVTDGGHVGAAFSSIRKAGTCVVVGLGNPRADRAVPLSLYELVLFQKRLQGSLFGACNPTRDIPALLELYRSGKLRLDELITTRYSLDQINEGFADMRAGRNIRGVIVFE
ncbi:NDMA-dependent alcohol dehydrogenase [Frankia sp. CNm7]|uniref:NDMA-dependent alcohol dehydrogenase n=1 Tax=Frankia nepalensis TaxID=1836974 RepID=A0A937REI3_9ACTN|nr:NDMA-dependent alcohol dehydrogenase [Frankia nepalensis]MBL7496655.1 NDMA-dependent alcohol dehydrogenase [Frankia nepalensis]MBL7510703.1 NDMA-dependent alcohol dehydrogenase [Frankia nepalensis]MBL7516664.1 NDMA-dependent alcohol dehydrogenase [Frankia nepalensis]MBL7627394.1 NDMA-dependent alcohol dehydrogenase [Frankia nepalensis]